MPPIRCASLQTRSPLRRPLLSNFRPLIGRLKGSSEEVKGAKEKLSAAIDKERIGIENANVALLKQGVAYQRIVDETKTAEQAASRLAAKEAQLAQTAALKELVAMKSALSGIGGPLAEISGKFESLSSIVKGADGAFGRVKIGLVATTAAVLAITAAIIGATVALGGWILKSADLNRSQQLLREGMAGSAQNAANLGTQVAALASKVATPTAELNQLSTTLLNIGLGGDQFVDTFNAIGQAAGAAGPMVSGAIQDWLTRGARFNRLQLSPLEMQKTGIQFQDVAKEYAKQTGIGLDAARQQLYLGVAKLEPGAKALRAVVDRMYAGINARKMLQLDTIAETFSKHLQTLTSGVDFEKIAKPLGEIMNLFDASSVSGAAMKDIITAIGKALGTTFEGGVPTIKTFIEELTLGALKLGIEFYKVRNAIRDSFAGDILKNLDPFKAALAAVGIVAATAAVGMGALAVATIGVWGPWLAIGSAITGALILMKKFYDFVVTTDWTRLGTAISDGFVNGIKATTGKVTAAISNMVGQGNDAAAKKLESHSPSKVYERLGKNSSDGYAQGVSGGQSNVTNAVTAMVSAPASGGGSGGGSSGPIQLTVEIHVNAGKSGQEIADKLSSPSFLSSLTHAFETMAGSAGIPWQTPVTP